MLWGHRAQHTAGVVQSGDLIPDGRLKLGDADRLENAAIANTVADVALTAAAPTNIALFGPWGSGKSSLYSMIEERIASRDKRVPVVRYDAWKYGGKDLKRHFIASVAKDLKVDDAKFDAELVAGSEESRIRLWLWLKNNWGSLLIGLGVSVVLAAFWISVLAGTQAFLLHDTFWGAAGGLVAASGTVFGLALAALIVGPKVLEGAVNKTVTPPPTGDDEFSKRFTALVEHAGINDGKRLVVFIDELDRCAPDDVVATLVDLKTFLEQPGCVFIVAVDRTVVEDALAKVPQAKPVRGDEPYYATKGAFLDKIFQHQIALPPLRPRALTLFARELVDEQGGLWRELRDHDRDLFELVVFALVPVHIRSPRRVKVLLNAYATNVRIAQSRGIAWIERATELAVLTVLQTEFPEVGVDLLRVPRLLALLRGTGPSIDSPEAQRVVEGYRPVQDAEPLTGEPPESRQYDETVLTNPVGDLLSEGGNARQIAVARQTSYAQLFAYLTKIAAAGIPDPHPDLLYLQTAGHRDGLVDPVLGDVIDFAADTSPDTVVAAFSEQSSDVLRVAVPLLVVVGEQTFGLGRIFAYESACRLVERLDWADVGAISKDLAPRVLPSVTDRRWPLQAVPGALRLASAAGQTKAASDLIALLKNDADDDLLVRVALGLPVMAQQLVVKFCVILTSDYSERPTPFHEALARLPLTDAVAVWGISVAEAMTALEQLEIPAPADAVPPSAASRPVGRVATAVSVPQPTGAGRQRLRELLAVAQSRPDGEELLSAIYASVQDCSIETLRDENAELAAEILPNMADPARVNRHVFAGLKVAGPSRWPAWTRLLREVEPDASVVASASELLTTIVLPQVATADVDDLPHITATVGALLPYLAPTDGDESAEVLAGLLAKLQWQEPASEPDDEWDARRKTVIDLTEVLRGVVGDLSVDRLLAADVSTPAREVDLDDDALAELLSRIDSLDVNAARILSADLDAQKSADGEDLALTRLRLRARVRGDGTALAVSELSRLDDGPDSTEAFSDWLTLGPTGVDIAAVIPHVSPARTSLERWARNATDDDRTAVWIALEKTAAVNASLQAVGRPGVNGAAVEHMASTIRSGSRQQDRDAAVIRLETARLSVRGGAGSTEGSRMASELAASLLESGIAGDARLARRVIAWAGGAARGYQARLRALFDAAAGRSNSPFGKSETQELERSGLLTKQKKRLGISRHNH